MTDEEQRRVLAELKAIQAKGYVQIQRCRSFLDENNEVPQKTVELSSEVARKTWTAC